MRAWVALAVLAAVAAAGDDERRADLLSGDWVASNRALDALVAQRAETAVPLLVEALALDESFLRRRAAQTLAVFGKDAAPAVPALVQALYDEDPLVGVYAAVALDAIGAQEAAPFLADAARTPPRGFAHVRLEGRPLLEGWIGRPYDLDGGALVKDPKAAARLREGLEQRSPALRAACAKALGDGGAVDAVPLLRAAVRDESFEVCGRAALALGKLGASDGETLAVLATAWQRKETFVRRNVAVALGMLGEPAFPTLAAALGGKDLRMRRWAALGVAACPVPPVPLLSLLRAPLEENDRTLRLLAIRALAAEGAEAAPAVPQLAVLLDAGDEEIVLAALGTLGRIGLPAAPAAPRILLLAEDGAYLRPAIVALGGIGVPEAMPLLVTGLEKGILEAADALAGMGDAGVAALVAETRNERMVTRSLAAGTIDRHRLYTPESVAALRRLAKEDPDEGLRGVAAQALLNAPTRDDEGLAGILERIVKCGRQLEMFWAVDLLLRKAKPETLVALLAHEDPSVRRAAAFACVKAALPEARAGLLRLLDDPDVRGDIAPFVAAQGGVVAVEPLLRALATDKRRRDLEKLAAAIASLGAVAVPPLSDALGNPDLRVAAAEVLARIGPPAAPAVPKLAALLADKDRRVLAAATRALAQIGSVEHLHEALLSRDIRLAAAARAAVAAGPTGLLEQLLDAAKHDPALRRSLTEALKGATGLPALAVLARDPDAAVRASAVRSIAQSDDPAAVPALVGALRDPDPAIRAAAAMGLQMHRGAAAEIVPALESLLRDERDPEVLLSAARLARVLGPPARPLLDAALASREKRLRLFAIDALAPDIVLARALQDDDEEVRVAAARGLSGNREALDPLMRALEDRSGRVRSAAARSLGSLGKDAAPAAKRLVERLAKGDREVDAVLRAIGPAAVPVLLDLQPKDRQALEGVLRGIGVRAAPPLLELLGGKEPGTRRKAAWALGLLGRDAEAGVPALTKALSDDDRQVAVQAAWALGEIGPAAKGAMKELERLLADPAMRSVATEALRKIKG